MIRSEKISLFVDLIWDWYSRHKRSLPWRDLHIADPNERAYQILVSEVMLQQTQVPRVIPAFKAFIERFSTLKDLASASNRDVLLQWRGMGYNSRALRLRDAAKTITSIRWVDAASTHRREIGFPNSMHDLLSIPGIGDYTAGAIRNFAFGIPTPCIDTNIRRILHRVFIGPEQEDGTWEKDDRYLSVLASEILEVAVRGQRKVRKSESTKFERLSNFTSVALPNFPTADWHAALMDFGSLVCTKRNPKWDICPLTKAGICKASYRVKTRTKNVIKKEPGREIAGRFVPNRIIRGRVVEALRDHPRLSLDELGERVCVDWRMHDHRAWLKSIAEKLTCDGLLSSIRQGKYALKI